jgi:DNA-binding protein H-NS
LTLIGWQVPEDQATQADPTPELPDDTPIEDVRFSTRIRDRSGIQSKPCYREGMGEGEGEMITAKNVSLRRRLSARDRLSYCRRLPRAEGEGRMNHDLDLESMSVDQLWSLREMIASVLARKITAEKERLEQRLRELGLSEPDASKMPAKPRRHYPKVHPKYRNPERPKETWAGRGKPPRWLEVQLRSGKKLEDFKIEAASDRRREPIRH